MTLLGEKKVTYNWSFHLQLLQCPQSCDCNTGSRDKDGLNLPSPNSKSPQSPNLVLHLGDNLDLCFI